MPTLTFDKKDLLNLIGRKIRDEELSHAISYLGTDLKRIEKDDIVVEIFPNRTDLLTIEGFARAIKAFLGIKTGIIDYKVNKSKEKIIIENNVKRVRPFIAGAIIRNIKVTDKIIKSLMQVQEKIHKTYGRNRRKVAIGIHDLKEIKFPLKYKAVHPTKISFIPLNETEEMNLEEILKKHPKGKDYAWILEDKEKYPILLDKDNQVVSFPPIINSSRTQVTEKTTDIFIEVTGEDENAVNKTLNILSTSLAMRGGKIYTIKVGKDETPNLKPTKMRFSTKYASEILGIELNEKKVKKLLKRMNLDYSNKKAIIPAYRTDILHPFDIVEDIAIAYGYDKIEGELPDISTIGEEDKEEKFSRKIIEMLIGFGLLETNTNNITNESEEKKAGFKGDLIQIKNSVTIGYTSLRKHILPSLMKVLSDNKHYDYPQNLFEINTVFYEDNDEETKVREEKDLGIVLCGKEEDFTKIKRIIDAIMRSINLNYQIEEHASETFIPGRAASIIINGEEIGFFGEVNPQVIENFQLDMPLVGAEIRMSRLFKILNNKNK